MARSIFIAVLSVMFMIIALKDITLGVKASEKQSNTRYTNIAPVEAKRRLSIEKGIVILDVRTKEEYSEKHIPGSTLIPLDILEKTICDRIPDKNTVIFVYCKSGRRSAAAADILVEKGFANVFNLGGIASWPYETE